VCQTQRCRSALTLQQLRGHTMLGKCLRRVALVIVATAAVSAVSNPSFAVSGGGNGKVSTYNLNGDVMGRGACIRTTPALPGSGWACVWYRDHLYENFKQLLLFAYINGKTCSISWSDTDNNGFGIIDNVECD
jgi:hypothetical protein